MNGTVKKGCLAGCIAALLLLVILALALLFLRPRSPLAGAQAALMSGNGAEAKRQFTSALREYRNKKDPHGEAAALLFLGLTDMMLDDVDGARADLQRAMNQTRRRNDFVGTWLALLILSQLERGSGNWTQALAHMEEALATIDEARSSPRPFDLETLVVFTSATGLPPGMATFIRLTSEQLKPLMLQNFLAPISHDLYGSLLTEVGRYDEAEAELNVAVAGSQYFQGMYDFSLAAHFGDLRYRQRRYDEARTHYQKALSGSLQTPMNPTGDPWIRVGIYDRLARLETLTGHIDKAMSWNDESLKVARRAAKPVQVCVTLESRGNLLMRSERFAEAEGAFKEAMKIAETTKSVPRQAAIESYLGNLQIQRGNYGSAAHHLERSVGLYHTLSDPKVEASAWGSLAQAYLLTDDFRGAEAALAKARTLVDQTRFSLADDIIAMSETWLRFRRGVATLNEVNAAFEQFKRNAQYAEMEIGPDIEQILLSTTKIMERGDFSGPRITSKIPAFSAYDAVIQGRQELERKNYEEARRIWRNAVDKTPSNDLRARLLAWIGASYSKEANFDQASLWFSKAVESLEKGARYLRSESMLAGYLGNEHRAYYDALIESFLQRGKIDLAFEATERARARAFLWLLGTHRVKPPARAGSSLAEEAETLRRKIANWDREPVPGEQLDDLRGRYEGLLARVRATSPEYVSMTSVEPLKLDAVRKELPGNTTLISYFVSPLGTHAWILDAHALEYVRLEVSDAQLHRITCWADQLGRTRAPLPVGGARECGADSAKAEEAYAALFAPLRDRIHTPRLMIVPHGALHYVPFAALYNAKTRKYLVEDYTITYVPSASTLRFLRSKESPVVAGRALVLGDPLTPRQSRLAGARKEAERVANRLHTTAKLGEHATEDLLYHLGGKVDLLHIAAHASYDANSPLFSAIYLAEGGGRNGELNVDEIQSEVDLEGVNLVVLSACRSGVGKRSGGDEVVGLTRSILYAGSPSVISTLWNISDDATTPLMEKFYDHLLTGPGVETSVADALREAQIDLLRDRRYSNPRYWAAFVLTGDPKGRWDH